jgi:aminoglycoside phosphotransferase (APT) family kinase protein
MPGFTLDEIPHSLAPLLPADGVLETAPQGMTSDVVFVTGARASVVVKRCTRAIYLDWLRNEHLTLRAIAGLGLRVPAALGYAEVSTGAGSVAWLVMTRLPGRSVWGVLLDSPPGARTPLLRKLGEAMRRIHAAPIPVAFAERPDWTARMLAQAERNLGWCDGTPEMLAELRRTTPAPAAKRLVHGDFALDNVLIDDAGNLRVIDWACGDAGDPRIDIALALQTKPETELTEPELLAFCEGYDAPAPDAATRRWFEQLYDFF